MTDLWLAIRYGRPRFGRPAFFPLAAYRQVKAIPFPAADWHNRLYADFRLDVAAAHSLLGRGARKARLVRVIGAGGRGQLDQSRRSAPTRSAIGTCPARGSSTGPAAGSGRSGSPR